MAVTTVVKKQNAEKITNESISGTQFQEAKLAAVMTNIASRLETETIFCH